MFIEVHSIKLLNYQHQYTIDFFCSSNKKCFLFLTYYMPCVDFTILIIRFKTLYYVLCWKWLTDWQASWTFVFITIAKTDDFPFLTNIEEFCSFFLLYLQHILIYLFLSWISCWGFINVSAVVKNIYILVYKT